MNLNKLKKYYNNKYYNSFMEIDYFYIGVVNYSGNNQIMMRFKNYLDTNLLERELILPKIIKSLLFSGDITKMQLALNLID